MRRSLRNQKAGFLFNGSVAITCTASIWGRRIAIFLLFCSSFSHAASLDFFLELVINGRNTGVIAETKYQDGNWQLKRDDLIAAGIKPEMIHEDLLLLKPGSTIAWEYDQTNQRLQIIVPVSFFPEQKLHHATGAESHIAVQRNHGLLINYSFYALGGDGSVEQQSLAHSFNYSTPLMTFISNGLYTEGDSSDRNGYLRLDSRAQYDNPQDLWTLVLGDSISGAPTWGRNFRVGGIRFARDFSLNPDLIRFPVPDFLGQAALPGSVELLVNQQQRFSSEVNPGPFVISSPSWTTGAGTASVITTDIQGRQTQQNINFYIVNELLKPGYSDYDITLGWLRKDFGLHSDNYHDAVLFSGLYRYGLNSYLTPEIFAQSSRDLNMAGAGLTTALGHWGSAEISYAESQYKTLRGNQYTLGYRYHNNHYGFNLRHIVRSENFRDAGAPEQYQIPQQETQAGISLTSKMGTISGSYFELIQRDMGKPRFINISWSKSFFEDITAMLSVSRRLDGNEGASFYLGLSFPVGRRAYGNASTQRDVQGNTSNYLQVMQQAPYAGGWGWSLATDDDSYHHAFIDWRSNTLAARAGTWGGKHQRSWSAEMSGSLVYMEQQWFAAREVTDAYALINTNGVAGVPVYIGYQPIGKTNQRGYFLISDLVGYANNRIAINPLDLHAAAFIPVTEQTVVPARQAGTVIHFPIEQRFTIIARLKSFDGNFLPAGTYLRDRNTLEEVIVGWDGDIYLESPEKRKWELVGEDESCVFTIPVTTDDNPFFAGTHTCHSATKGVTSP